MPWIRLGCTTPKAALSRTETPSQSGFPLVALARHNSNTPVELRPPTDRVQSRAKAQARITRRDRERIVELYKQGWSGSRIAADLNIAKSTVYANLRRFDVDVLRQHIVY